MFFAIIGKVCKCWTKRTTEIF